MENELTKVELNEQDMKELTKEELVDLKIKLEELLIDCEDIIQSDDEDEV